MGWIFPLARLPPIKFPPAGLLPAVHSRWSKSKNSLHDCSAAKFPSFHPSSQPECSLSGLLLWCCIRQFWNNNLKTALKPAKGKTSSHYCAIVQIICHGFAGNLEMAIEVPEFETRGWLAASHKELHKSQAKSSILPFWTGRYFECKQDRYSLARAVGLCWFLTMEDWEGEK